MHTDSGRHGDALAAAGIALDPALVWRGGYAFVGGARAVQRCLALPVAERPTAIFVASDEMAIGAVSALRENGIAVPEDISVAGFDGIDYSAMYEPPLTTMLQPRSELGRLAAEELVRQLSGQADRKRREDLEERLLDRGIEEARSRRRARRDSALQAQAAV